MSKDINFGQLEYVQAKAKDARTEEDLDILNALLSLAYNLDSMVAVSVKSFMRVKDDRVIDCIFVLSEDDNAISQGTSRSECLSKAIECGLGQVAAGIVSQHYFPYKKGGQPNYEVLRSDLLVTRKRS